MPRFVVLRHELPAEAERASHWDFMLEAGDALRTWALAEPPDVATSQLAEALADHRRAYLEYEGEVSGGRGVVSRWDAGEFELIEEGTSSSGEIVVRLAGARLRGVVRLSRTSAAPKWRYSYASATSARDEG